jgi:hypothetical protein
MGHNKEDGAEETENRGYEYLAFELADFYLHSLKKECIDRNTTLNQMIIDLVGSAVKDWPNEAREEQRLRYKRVTAKVPSWIYTKLNARKEETNIPIKGLVLLILGLHYCDFDTIREIVLGNALPPLPHMQNPASST